MYRGMDAIPINYGSARRGGFWRRFIASLLDGVLIGALNVAILVSLRHGPGDFAGLGLGVAYFTILEGGLGGQTLGKRAVGLRVVSYETGGPIGYQRAFVRYWGRLVSALVFYLGFLSMIWDREKQCWHDKFAQDLVVPIADFPVYTRVHL